MKVCICCSSTFANEVQEITKLLEVYGHEVLTAKGIEKVRDCDVVLVCNFLKDCIPGYIGANTFAEIYGAHYLGKTILSLFPVPDMPYINDEIRTFAITSLNGDLNFFVENSAFGSAQTTAPETEQANSQTDAQVASAPTPAPTAPVDPHSDEMTIPNLPNNSAANTVNDTEQTKKKSQKSLRAILRQVRDSWFALWKKDEK